MVDKGSFDEGFWVFVHLVCSDEKYLSAEGKFIKKIVEQHKGYFGSMTDFAKKFCMDKRKASKMIKDYQSKGVLMVIDTDCRKKMVKFNDELVNKALSMPRKIKGEVKV